ncbi:AAC-rich mRNA clone AAC11 protein-like, partial [Uranotaenia lowii]|uniref:AAC-rich mRNA clone AAC11 protein-like n=1 Tax=Uranotaenia lowii TaxID=190385 RepID=UPI00247909DF
MAPTAGSNHPQQAFAAQRRKAARGNQMEKSNTETEREKADEKCLVAENRPSWDTTRQPVPKNPRWRHRSFPSRLKPKPCPTEEGQGQVVWRAKPKEVPPAGGTRRMSLERYPCSNGEIGDGGGGGGSIGLGGTTIIGDHVTVETTSAVASPDFFDPNVNFNNNNNMVLSAIPIEANQLILQQHLAQQHHIIGNQTSSNNNNNTTSAISVASNNHSIIINNNTSFKNHNNILNNNNNNNIVISSSGIGSVASNQTYTINLSNNGGVSHGTLPTIQTAYGGNNGALTTTTSNHNNHPQQYHHLHPASNNSSSATIINPSGSSLMATTTAPRNNSTATVMTTQQQQLPTSSTASSSATTSGKLVLLQQGHHGENYI